MRNLKFSLSRLILIVLGILILLRFSPVLLRMGQALAAGLKAYWWLALPSLIGLWLIWKLRRRVTLSGSSRQMFDQGTERDVTNSFKEQV